MQEGQPGAGATGTVQQPVSTGQGSLEEGGEREHMEQVCASHAWLMSCRLMQVSTPGGNTFCILLWAHSRGGNVSGELGSLAPLVPTAHADFEEATNKRHVHK